MKIIGLGDTHGRTDWIEITNNNDFDKVVFIGDYFDSHDYVSCKQQKENFIDIIGYKKSNMNKVILLFGNHDYHYLKTTTETYSGYQSNKKAEIQHLLHKAIDENLMQICYLTDNILFTHAGVTKTWCRNTLGNESPKCYTIENEINNMFVSHPEVFKFTVGKNYDYYGEDINQTPIWVRPRSLLSDKIDNYIQVVGHTQMNKLSIIGNIAFIDTLGTSGEYLQIVDGILSSRVEC